MNIQRLIEQAVPLRPSESGQAQHGLRETMQRSQDMRFDCEGRVEIWITQDELEDDPQIVALKADARPFAEKLPEARLIATELAWQKLNSLGDESGISVTAEPGVSSINLDRVDWLALLSPDED